METPRVWQTAVRCPECSYPNDMTFAFCQQCGYKRKHVDAPHPSPSTSVDLEKLDARLLELDNRSKKKQYSKQKDKLQEEFTNFLSAIPGEKHLLVATAKDVVRFLAWKDKSGRTKVHSPQCRYFSFSSSSKQTVCKCPTRLAAGSVDSLIGKLRTIFATAGRGNSWNDVGNPVSVIQPLILMLRNTSKPFKKNKPRLGSHQNKLSRYSSRNCRHCVNICGQRFLSVTPPLLKDTLRRVTWLSLTWNSSQRTGPRTSVGHSLRR